MRSRLLGVRTIAVAICVVAASSFWGCTQTDLEAGRDKVRSVLKDGSSAQFRSERLYKHDGRNVYCGEVNAKNGFGGYTGFGRFVVLGDVVTLHREHPIPAKMVKASGGDNDIAYQSDVVLATLEVGNVLTLIKNDLLRERIDALKAGGAVGPQPSEQDYERMALERLAERLEVEFCVNRNNS